MAAYQEQIDQLNRRKENNAKAEADSKLSQEQIKNWRILLANMGIPLAHVMTEPGRNSRAMLPLLEEIAERDAVIDRLRAQLQNCVDYLHHVNRRYPREDMTKVIESANKALYETLNA